MDFASKPETAVNAQKRTSLQLSPLFRTLRIQIVWQCTKWSISYERPKVALYRNHGMTILHSIYHMVPLAASITLLVLNFRVTFIGHVPPTTLTAIQFGAKFLEILIHASIAAMLLSVIRLQVLGSKPMPFGGLLAPYRIADVSYLWSLEFWGSVTSTCIKDWHQVAVLFLSMTAVLLAALVGPSSAVLMVPRPMTIVRRHDLGICAGCSVPYPQNMDLVDGKFQYEAELASTFNQSVVLSGLADDRFSVHYVVDPLGARTLQVYTSYHGEMRTLKSTIPTRISANLLTRLGQELKFQIAQPYVFLDCWESLYDSPEDLDEFIDFGPSKQYLNNTLPSSRLLQNYTSANEPGIEVLEIAKDIVEYVTNLSANIYFQEVQSGSNDSALIVYKQDSITNDVSISSNGSLVFACVADAYWIKVSTNQTSTSAAINEDPDQAMAKSMDKQLINLTPSWLKRAVAAGLTAQSSEDALLYAQTSLSSILAIALSAIAPADAKILPYWGSIDPTQYVVNSNTNLTETQWSALVNYLNQQKLFDKYDMIEYFPSAINWSDPVTLTQVDMEYLQHGYGYNTSTITVRLSLVVIFIYACVCLIYLLCVLFIGVTATSWDTVAELLTLALHSHRPRSLNNTSIGIDTLETFRQPVNIRINEENDAEMVFLRDHEDSDLKYRKVRPGEKY